MHSAIATLALAGALVFASTARSLTIDSFSTGSLAFVPANTTSDVQVGGGMLGGERDESVTNSSSGGGILAGGDDGAYLYGALSAEGSALLVWDGADGDAALDPLGLGGIDLTEGGSQSGFAIEILSNDFIATLVLTVYSSAVDFSQTSVLTPGGIPSGPAQTLFVPFADLVPSGSGADFANVGALSLEIDGSGVPQLDLSIDAFATSASLPVPEPASLGQLVLGLIGLAAFARRHTPR